MRVVVAGGHGRVARRLERLLAGRGDEAVGLVRDPGHVADLEAVGARGLVLDLEAAAVDDVVEAVRDADAVVFAAGAGPGSGPERKRTVDLGAAVKLVDAAEAAGVRRYLMVSSIGAQDPSSAGPQMQPYLEAKAEADEALSQSELDWTIVRPGRPDRRRGHGARPGRDDARAARADPARRRRGGARGGARGAADDRQDLRGVHGRHADRRGPASALTPGGDGHRGAAVIRRARAGTPWRVLSELRVENLLLIERAELRLAPGLNVLTGETGAGKTVLAHALDLLLGGRARGSGRAPGGGRGLRRGRLRPARRAARTSSASGCPPTPRRSCSPGASAPRGARAPTSTAARPSVGDLRDLAEPLVAFYGQHEHRRLTLASAQLALLDDACGPEQAARRDACAAAWARARALERTLAELAGARRGPRARARPARVRAGRDRGGGARRGRGGRAAARAASACATSRRCGRPPGGRAEAVAPEDGGRRGRAAGRRRRRARRGGRASTRSSTRWPSAGGRWPSRPTTSPPSCAATPRASRREPGRARGRRGAPGASWTACSASTAGRSRPCSPTPRPAGARRAELDGRRGGAGRGRPRRWRTPGPSTRRLAAALREARARAGAAPGDRRPRAPGRPGHGGRDVRDRAGRPRAGPDGHGRGRVRHRAQRRRAGRAAARDRVGRRAVAGHARDPLGGQRDRRRRDARLRRDRRRHRRRTPRARWARSCARWPRAGSSSASRTCRRSPRWRRAHFSIAKDPRAEPARTTVAALDEPAVVGELVRMLGRRRRRRGRAPPREGAPPRGVRPAPSPRGVRPSPERPPAAPAPLLRRVELQRERVHAVALAAGPGPSGKT